MSPTPIGLCSILSQISYLERLFFLKNAFGFMLLALRKSDPATWHCVRPLGLTQRGAPRRRYWHPILGYALDHHAQAFDLVYTQLLGCAETGRRYYRWVKR